MPITKNETGPSRKAFTPEMAQASYGHEYPRVPVTPPFLYVYNPQRWALIDGRVLPSLHKVPLMRGLNGVTKQGGRWRLARLRDKLESQGRTMIPWEWGPDGESYVAAVDTRDRHGNILTTYVSAFSETYAGSSVLGADVKAYADWIEALITDGRLPKPQPYIVERLLTSKRAALSDALTAQRHHHTEQRAEVIANLEVEVKQLEAMVTGAPKTPTRKRKAKIEVE